MNLKKEESVGFAVNECEFHWKFNIMNHMTKVFFRIQINKARKSPEKEQCGFVKNTRKKKECDISAQNIRKSNTKANVCLAMFYRLGKCV